MTRGLANSLGGERQRRPQGQGGLRVLVVEDETLLALSLESMIEDWGHELAGSVATGDDAVRHALDGHPDVVLMDVHLAGQMDGISAAEQILASCDVPLIFMTAYSDRDILFRLRQFDADVLRKPFAPRQLQDLLEQVMPRH